MPVVTGYTTPVAGKVGLDIILTREANGFPDQGLQALYLFTNGSGTAVDDELGGSDGLIEHPIAINNAFSWLSGGGGLQVEGTEIVTFPAFDITGPWTILSAGTVTGSVGGTGSERLTTILAFRDWPNFSSVRGAAVIVRGGNDWNTVTTAPFYQGRPSNGAGGLGTAVNMAAASGLIIIDTPVVCAMSYNGTDTLTTSVYDVDGQLLASASIPVTDAQLTTGTGSIVDTTLQPTVGGVNGTFGTGQQYFEAFARYDRVLTGPEIGAFVDAAAAIGSDRGRPWA